MPVKGAAAMADDDPTVDTSKTDTDPAADPSKTDTDPAGAGDDGLGDAGKRALAAEREAAKQAQKEAKEAQAKLKEREDADLSEAEKAKKEAKESQERADKAEAKLMHTEVAEKKKLKPGMASRLAGDTKEELEKDADKLLKELGGAGGGSNFDGGVKGGSRTGKAASPMNDFIKSVRPS
jgi:hypothetical protein